MTTQSIRDMEKELMASITAPVSRSRHQTAVNEEAAAAAAQDEAQATATELSNNPFMVIRKDPKTTETKKAALIKAKVTLAGDDPLRLTQEDIEAANQTFSEFEAYYRSIQDTSIDTDLDAIRQLMERIKNSISPKMKEMIEKLTGANTNIGECKDLLDVLKTARMLGKTIEQLRDAVRENAKLETDIAKAKDAVQVFGRQKAELDKGVTEAIEAIDADGKKTLGSFRHSWMGIPDHLAKAMERAEKARDDKNKELEDQAADLAAMEFKFQKELTEGPLRILRSFDMTQDGLKDRIQSAANDVIATVESIRDSVRILLVRVTNSEKAMNGITTKIENTRLDRTTLIGALNEAYKDNQEKADQIGARADDLKATLDGVEKDSIEATETRIEYMTQQTNHQNVLRYGERINKLLQTMQASDATSVLAAHDANEVTTSVLNNKDGLNELYNHTLPTLSQAMGLVLHQFVDEQDQEHRMAISAITRDLGKTAEGTAERALEQQKQFHAQKMLALNDIIAQLDSSSDLLGKFMKTQVSGAVEEQGVLGKLRGSAENLRDGVEASGRVASEVRKRVRGMQEAAEEVLSGTPTPTQPDGGALSIPRGSNAKAFAL